jgi:uncharacterized protein YajQ (UPF0234 family)
MPSLDVVSTIDLQALDNAVNNVKREISTRFDFRNFKSEVEFDRKAKVIHVMSVDEWKVKTISDMLISQCVRQKIDPKSLDFGKIDVVTQNTARMDINIKEGIPRETAGKIVKYIKEMKLKVQPVIQEDQLRISGKQIDDLQTIMRVLGEQDFGVPLQFVNLKR